MDVSSLVDLHLELHRRPDRHRNLQVVDQRIAARQAAVRSQTSLKVDSRTSHHCCHLDMGLDRQSPLSGTAVCLWSFRPASEPHMKVLSPCCWHNPGPRSLTVAQVGSHICWEDPRSPAAWVLWEPCFDCENGFWTSRAHETYLWAEETWRRVVAAGMSQPGRNAKQT